MCCSDVSHRECLWPPGESVHACENIGEPTGGWQWSYYVNVDMVEMCVGLGESAKRCDHVVVNFSPLTLDNCESTNAHQHSYQARRNGWKWDIGLHVCRDEKVSARSGTQLIEMRGVQRYLYWCHTLGWCEQCHGGLWGRWLVTQAVFWVQSLYIVSWP